MPERPLAEISPLTERAKALYRAGQLSEAIVVAEQAGLSEPADRLLHASALYDLGESVRALQLLSILCDDLRDVSDRERFSAEFALFVRQSTFEEPNDASHRLASLRQLATAIGDAPTLAGLHLAVAKLEALRGRGADSRTHLDTAKRLANDGQSITLMCSIELVSASPLMYVGNIDEARLSAIRGYELAIAAGLKIPLSGSLANLGSFALSVGDANRAREYLRQSRDMARELSFVKLAIADTLANAALFEGDSGECAAYLDETEALIASQHVPARSLYDFVCQITRCLYLSHLQDWDAIIRIVDAAHPELERRQLRVWHASLLSAKARALAYLGDHDAADATLLAALRMCPKGAVDPLITVEAATGTCLTLRGEAARGARHFDRALRACRAISHHFHEWAVTTERAALPSGPAAAARPADTRSPNDTENTSLILADVATLLDAGHSIDVMAQRLTAIISATPLGSRLSVSHEPLDGEDVSPGATVSWETEGDGRHRILLSDPGRRLVLHLDGVASLEEVSLVRNLVETTRAAIGRAGNAGRLDGELLWPEVALPSSGDSVFWSPRMQEIVRIAIKLAASDLPVLITGETGTGKEVIARLIHAQSKWARGPFVPFNAAAIPRDLVESQLFGHRRGAFTGAAETSGGVFRAAERGTLFLDEIGDLDPAVQPKLLRFLETGEVHPVGEPRPVQTRVRIVAATNAPLDTLVKEGRFRSDLLYRLEVTTLRLPPLRERKDEIPALAAVLVRKACKEIGRDRLTVADDFIAALLMHDWPGNIRQLANEIRRAVALADDGATLSVQDLSPEIARAWRAKSPARTEPPVGPAFNVRLDQRLEQAIEDLERAFVERALVQTHGRVSEAAKLLGLSRKGLFLKRRKLGLV